MRDPVSWLHVGGAVIVHPRAICGYLLPIGCWPHRLSVEQDAHSAFRCRCRAQRQITPNDTVQYDIPGSPYREDSRNDLPRDEAA